ncbi:MAG: membrane protein insertion efficiency factor YidD [Micavibrio sp.]|nr:membrane protein insertion efficiency factor YidD [Micavibrio sp.]
MIRILQAPVQVYRYVISPNIPKSCRFYPSCSAYMLEALEKHGPVKGLWLGLRRLSKCHPWCKCDYHDPVP